MTMVFWLSTAVILVLGGMFASETFLRVLQTLIDLDFLCGFFWVFSSALATTFVAGSTSIVVGRMIRKSKYLSNYAISYLRLGLWLPFYLFWGLSFWRIPEQGGEYRLGLYKITIGLVATGPSVFLAACYHYLLATTKFADNDELKRAYFSGGREVFLFALLLTLLWQMFFPRAWPWGWLVYSLEGGYATIVMMVAAVAIVNLVFGWTLNSRAEVGEEQSIAGSSAPDSNGLIFFLILSLSILALWQGLASLGAKSMSFVGPWDVSKAIVQLLVTKSNAFANSGPMTLWFDMGESLFNTFAGIGFGTLLAVAIVGLFTQLLALKLSSFIISLTCIAPMGLTSLFFGWVGIGSLSKILTVVSFAFFSIAQGIWFHRNTPVASRILLSMADGLPFAFLGMVFSEAMAATAGLGFLMVVFPADGKLAEATATGLIAFAMLVLSSILLRLAARQASLAK